MAKAKGIALSYTPKTDAEVERVKKQCAGEYHLEGGDFVNTDFARQLELDCWQITEDARALAFVHLEDGDELGVIARRLLSDLGIVRAPID